MISHRVVGESLQPFPQHQILGLGASAIWEVLGQCWGVVVKTRNTVSDSLPSYVGDH